MYLTTLLIAAGLGTAVPSTPVQTSHEEICVGVAILWRGRADDIRQIERVPVPDSYRHMFNAGDCTRFSLVEESLLDWHFQFGNERTAAGALAFLEADYIKSFHDPKPFAKTLAKAIKRARPSLVKGQAELAEARKENRYLETLRPIMKQAPIAALLELLHQHSKYVFLTQQYARAAEFYGSAAFLEKARQFDQPASEALPLIYGPGALADTDFVSTPDWEAADVRDLGERLAILQARLTRDPADIDRAQAILDEQFDPALLVVLHESLGPDEVCNPARNSSHDDLKRACEADPNFELTMTRFWTNQANLDLLKVADPLHYHQEWGVGSSGSDFARGMNSTERVSWGQIRSADAALTLLNPERTGHVGGTIRTGREDRRIALHIAWAEALSALATRANPENIQKNDGPDEYLRGALQQLEQAADLVRPSEQAGRFRQIAERYLELAGRYTAVVGPNRTLPATERQAAYFHAVLARLDAIKLGK